MAQDMSPRKGAKRVLHGRSLQGMAVLGGAVLLGTTFLSTPVTAQTVEELRAQISELSQRVDQLQNQNVATPMIAPAQAVTAGSFPGSIKLPGTNTSFKVGGYVTFDLHWTSVQGLGDAFSTTAIPLEGSARAASDGTTRLLARRATSARSRPNSRVTSRAAATRPCRTGPGCACATPTARSATSRPARPGPAS